MEKHIAAKHKPELQIVIAEKEARKKRKAEESRERPPKKLKTIHVKLDLEEVEDACVDMVTINGRPFTALDDSGFRRILDPVIEALGSGEVQN